MPCRLDKHLFTHYALPFLLFSLFSLALFYNLFSNLENQGLRLGFSFLTQEAGFEIGDKFFFSYESTQSYLHAFLIGLSNTVMSSILIIFFSTLLGFILGLLRFSSLKLYSLFASFYSNIFRNIPLVIQLYFFYHILINYLPSARESYNFFGLDLFFLNNRGLFIPRFGLTDFSFSYPVLEGFNYFGGSHFTPELIVLVFGSSLYAAAFISEIVLAGLKAIPGGQLEAARSLGMSERNCFSKIIFPQSVKIIIPPLTNQWPSIIKNSSLAVAIGYPDLLSVVNTGLNQTGKAIECLSLIILVYLLLSLVSSFFLNYIAKKFQYKNE